MKTFSTTLLLALCVYTQSALAQGTAYCGPYYSYDDAGNRISRGFVICDTRMLWTSDSSSNTSPDSTINPNLTASIFPNPTSDAVSIVFNNPVNSAQIIITDNTGRQLYSTTTGGSSIPLSLANFSQGIYYITIRTGSNTFQSSIIRQ